MSERYDLIVIGAGISGLATAFEAQQAGLRVLLLEKGAMAGGCFDSASVDGAEPFWLEMGTHTCFNSYGRLLNLLEQLGLKEKMAERRKLSYRMLVDGQIRSIPSQLSFIELFANAWRIFSATKAGKSVTDYYRSIVGNNNYQKVFRHAFNAVICQQADEVPADMLFRKRRRDKSVMRSYTFDGGLGRIIAALEQQLDCRKEVNITGITYREEQGFAVTTASEVLHAWRLAVATPVQAASRLLADAFPELSSQLARVNEVEIESVGVVVRKDDLLLDDVAGIIAADGDFYSAVSRDYVEHPSLRGFAFHFKPDRLDHAQKVKRACSVLGIDSGTPVRVMHKINRLPAPDMEHHSLMAKVDEMLADKPLALVGNYFNGVAVEDCLERVDSELARLLP